ncbi:hypothetical protein L484_027012 [Morus notabilis]|uniref:Uncharacterized protein n=1 Tax=Morus notabilis TaxID=981085 RepID=W9RBT5_9ROSA|nr:hypothetical protein L484_027012 [Morus notabilis]
MGVMFTMCLSECFSGRWIGGRNYDTVSFHLLNDLVFVCPWINHPPRVDLSRRFIVPVGVGELRIRVVGLGFAVASRYCGLGSSMSTLKATVA